MTVSIELLEVGSTVHREFMVLKGGSNKSIRFPASVALIEHSTYGICLFDTGYSPKFYDLCRTYPEKFYSLITPVSIAPQDTVVAQVRACGIAPHQVKNVIVSHFHADHIGGLRDFPQARFIYDLNAFAKIENAGLWNQVFRYGFLAGLIPEDFKVRSWDYKHLSRVFSGLDAQLFPFAYDLFGDETVLILELPGHAPGHLGVLVRSKQGDYFLVGDACWLRRNITENHHPSFIANKLITYDQRAYRQTQSTLSQLAKQSKDIEIIPCHCLSSLREAAVNLTGLHYKNTARHQSASL